MNQDRINKCREWIARREAELDQLEKRYTDEYPLVPPRLNLVRINEIEAQRFWIDIHRWELDQMIETGVDDYPQNNNND